MNKYIKIFAALLFAMALCSCEKAAYEAGGKIQVVATLFPQYDFARIIGGERMQVEKLLPWGADSHSYEATIKDIGAINNADIVIYTGEDMEPWVQNLISSARGEGTRVLDLSLGIERQYLHEEVHAHPDPHIWTSPKNAVRMVRSIEAVFAAHDGEGADYYKKNADSLVEQLIGLDAELSGVAGELSGKMLYFGGRFAFLYMFCDYGMNYMSVYDGCGEEADPGIKRINEMVAAMKKDGSKIIFCEEMSEGKIAKSIADEVGSEVLVLHSCHNLSANDAKSGENYISLMRKNIENLKKCIG